MTSAMRKYTKYCLQAMGELIFPPFCLACGGGVNGEEKAICASCRQEVAYISSPLCRSCGRVLNDSTGGDHLCGMCLQNRPAYTSARGIVHYQEPVTDLLHRFKYQGDTSVLPAFKAIIRNTKVFELQDEDRVVVVPLHLKRLRNRGFNQALLLAELFFPDRKKQILVDALQRIRHTVPQTGLDGITRRKNLRKAFAVSTPEKIAGRRIILVDDVYTTGTTVNECSKVLLRADAVEVHVVTLARV